MIAEILEPVKPVRYNGVTRIQTVFVKPVELNSFENQLEKANQIARYVFSFYGLDIFSVKKRSRKADNVLAKRVAIGLICSNLFKLKDRNVAAIFGIDRTTVIFYRSSFNDYAKFYKEFKTEVNSIAEILKLRTV